MAVSKKFLKTTRRKLEKGIENFWKRKNQCLINVQKTVQLH